MPHHFTSDFALINHSNTPAEVKSLFPFILVASLLSAIFLAYKKRLAIVCSLL
ncbi:hypothetical protein BSM4216_2784 [Bacillus smithii]|nr:hypothetical protein BSM4216_2784 [Bacillus smithii]